MTSANRSFSPRQGMTSPPLSARGMEMMHASDLLASYDKPCTATMPTDSFKPSPSSPSRERGAILDRFTLVSDPVAEIQNPSTPRQTPWIDSLPDTGVTGSAPAYPRRSSPNA